MLFDRAQRNGVHQHGMMKAAEVSQQLCRKMKRLGLETSSSCEGDMLPVREMYCCRHEAVAALSTASTAESCLLLQPPDVHRVGWVWASRQMGRRNTEAAICLTQSLLAEQPSLVCCPEWAAGEALQDDRSTWHHLLCVCHCCKCQIIRLE
jgi:hypothetical protein